MKKLSILLACLISVSIYSQHKGNYDHNYQQYQISRQNVAGNLHNSGNAPARLQQQPAMLSPNSTLPIQLKALTNVKASSYTAIFNVVQIGETAEETQLLMKERIDNVKQALLSSGIPSKDLVVDVISFIPVYETVVERKLFSKKYNEIPVGFELQQNLHIRFHKTHTFEKILNACASNEIYNLVKVDYFIKDIHLIYKKLQDELLKLVADKKAYYKTLGFDLENYNPVMADHKYCYYPKDFYRSYQAFNSISMQAIKKNKGVTKAKKQTSYYYQPLTYETYDLVLNPSILEPVVQVGMDIKIVYSPKPKEVVKSQPQKEKNNYFVISPNGNIDIKKLDTRP